MVNNLLTNQKLKMGLQGVSTPTPYQLSYTWIGIGYLLYQFLYWKVHKLITANNQLSYIRWNAILKNSANGINLWSCKMSIPTYSGMVNIGACFILSLHIIQCMYTNVQMLCYGFVLRHWSFIRSNSSSMLVACDIISLIHNTRSLYSVSPSPGNDVSMQAQLVS